MKTVLTRGGVFKASESKSEKTSLTRGGVFKPNATVGTLITTLQMGEHGYLVYQSGYDQV